MLSFTFVTIRSLSFCQKRFVLSIFFQRGSKLLGLGFAPLFCSRSLAALCQQALLPGRARLKPNAALLVPNRRAKESLVNLKITAEGFQARSELGHIFNFRRRAAFS